MHHKRSESPMLSAEMKESLPHQEVHVIGFAQETWSLGWRCLVLRDTVDSNVVSCWCEKYMFSCGLGICTFTDVRLSRLALSEALCLRAPTLKHLIMCVFVCVFPVSMWGFKKKKKKQSESKQERLVPQ